MKKDNLGDRMKGYENIERRYLTKRTPTLIRLDGKAFHTFTRGFKRPFDEVLSNTMHDTTLYLCKNIQGCKIAYTQSDEITILLTDYDDLNTSAYFDKNIQKIASITASMATLAFNKFFKLNVEKFIDNPEYKEIISKYKSKFDSALFDSRVYNIPKEEVCNAFIWRQQDATRNAIQMIGQSNFSHKQLQNKNCNQIQEMLFQEKSINFNNFPTKNKRGVCVIKETYLKEGVNRSRWVVDYEIPIFTQDRNYIEKYI